MAKHKARFILRDPQAKNSTAIYLVFDFAGGRLKYSTGHSIEPALWDSESQRPHVGKKYPAEHVDLKQHLDTLATDVAKCHLNLTNNDKKVTTAILKDALEEKTGKRAGKSDSLADFADTFCNEVTADRKPNTILAYRTTIKKLRAYEQKKRRQFSFEEITLDWYNDFKKFLVADSLSENSIGKHFKTIKTWMSQARDRKLHNSEDYLSKRFAIHKAPADSIYLPVADLEHFAALQVDKLSLEHVRDTFILSAFTGLRHGDVSRVNTAQVVEMAGGKVLKVQTEKTGKVVKIPLHPIAEAILNKYDGMPPQYTNAGTNRLLKILSQLAGWNEVVEVKVGKDTTKKERWELVSMHTARRSFITNAYKSGVPLYALMQLTGHTKITTLQTYLRISSEENAETLLQHDFFKATPVMRVA